MTNESAILGLLAELYAERAALAAENAQLRQQVAALTATEPESHQQT